jgi:hypothetical protein
MMAFHTLKKAKDSHSILFFVLFGVLILVYAAVGKEKPRARDLGIPFDGKPGSLDAITDVKGVEVGQVTIILGEGPLVVGKGACPDRRDRNFAAREKV